MLPGQIRRSATGYRMYGPSDLEWLRVCTHLRASGMPLETIRRYVGLLRQGNGNETARLDVLRAQQAQVAAKVDGLTACLDLIAYKIDVYERSSRSTVTRSR
ncbi:MerR family transcriptional regulator [Plantactinospora sp. B6F1]|uniref:MerR family transcriptional regulator n=1 Tax=Plantactinospora sp. B6F1 TaxID=3158971 RepID=UPI0032D90AB3